MTLRPALSIGVFGVPRRDTNSVGDRCALRLYLYHIDLTTALLREKYDGSAIYIQSPIEFDGASTARGCAVDIQRNMYDFPNAARKCADGLKRHLVKQGCKPIAEDTNVYVSRTSHNSIYVSQPHLAKNYINSVQMNTARTAQTHFIAGLTLEAAKYGEKLVDIKRYQQ